MKDDAAITASRLPYRIFSKALFFVSASQYQVNVDFKRLCSDLLAFRDKQPQYVVLF